QAVAAAVKEEAKEATAGASSAAGSATAAAAAAATAAAEELATGHILVYLLERKMDVFTFTVINTGNINSLNGLEYHPVTYAGAPSPAAGAEAGSPKVKY